MAGTTVQMFVLGSLMQEPAHGYQLTARVKRWHVDNWAGFGSGSIYNALGTLERQGAIERMGTKQQGGYAPATVYGITEQGHERFRELLEAVATSVADQDPFDLVCAFLGLLLPEERKELIEARLAAVERRLAWGAERWQYRKSHAVDGPSADWVSVVFERGRDVLKLALETTHKVRALAEHWPLPEPLADSRRSLDRPPDQGESGEAVERREP
jgi:DNA-binding PadR family transcriptional regulator